MNKKILTVAAVLAVFAAFNVSAAKKVTGIGLQGGWNPVGNGYGAAVTFKLSSLPCVFAADANFANNQLNAIGLTADWWLQNPKLGGMVHYFYGPGFAAAFYPPVTGFFFGGRLVAGINAFVLDPLEIYLQAAWEPGMYFDSNTSGFVWNNWPINFGFRFWF